LRQRARELFATIYSFSTPTTGEQEMKKLIILSAAFLIAMGSFCPKGNAQDLKKGMTSGKFTYSGTYAYIAIGEERAHMTYEMTGVLIPEPGKSIFKNASVRCIGAYHAIRGHYDNDKGTCVYNDSDGDRFFITYIGTGDMGKGGKGNYEYLGGTGKYAGLSGKGEYELEELKPAKEGTFQGISTYTANWELP
jgi:hypothetical protein